MVLAVVDIARTVVGVGSSMTMFVVPISMLELSIFIRLFVADMIIAVELGVGYV